MADLVTLTIDGIEVQAPAGTLVINAAKNAGIEIPSFCYYEGLELQAACRMCLVEVEKSRKLLPSCTLPVAEGMVVRTNTPQVIASRKAMLEFLLTNHPLDCPVCDKGGECELQDTVFRYGNGESRFTHIKHHVEEKQFSPLVFYDAPRCILCYRCVRICDEGLGVKALGVVARGAVSEIAPNNGDHLECDECGMCIDICPVGALTSSVYRYHTRPWEMEHIGVTCAHCSNGCKTTLGVRNNQIIRANNRDRSGINGEFLCIKGRFAFDFVHHEERLRQPLVRTGGELRPAEWGEAITRVAGRFREVKERGGKFGVAGSPRLTNEEIYFLQRFVRRHLGSNNLDHQRSGDVASLLRALAGRAGALATVDDVYHAKALLVVASDLAQQHPLLAFQARANWRHHEARAYVVTPGPVREDLYARRSLRAAPGEEFAALESLRDDLRAEPELVALFGDAIKGGAVARLVEFGDSLGIPVKYVCLADYANSRGAMDMGLTPELLPGYRPVSEAGLEPGLSLPEMLAAPDLDVFWAAGADPLAGGGLAADGAFVVVQDLFLTETARRADVVLPSAAAYEKSGTFTNVCGQVQLSRRGLIPAGAKPDLDIMRLIAARMGIDAGPATSRELLREIVASVPGYDVSLSALESGGAAATQVSGAAIPQATDPALIASAGDTLFTSGGLERYSTALRSVIESPGGLYQPLERQASPAAR